MEDLKACWEEEEEVVVVVEEEEEQGWVEEGGRGWVGWVGGLGEITSSERGREEAGELKSVYEL